jgi:hypothetical protein
MGKLSKVPNANKIIYVEWIDCITRQGWMYGEEMKDWGLNHTIQTIGFLAYEADDALTVIQSYDAETNGGCNWLCIPKTNIKKLIRL